MTQAVIEVSHLPSAASFYAAVTQPFGIRFLSSSSNGGELYFGFPAFPPSPQEVILTLVAVPDPIPTTITFTAQSRETVKEFHDRALRAVDFDTTQSIEHISSGSSAQIYDLDGNLVEANYSARRASEPAAPPPKTGSRIEAWREDVSKSSMSTTTEIVPRSLARSASDPLAYRDKETGKGGLIPGISNQGLIGTLLGAAAGAAIAYAMVRSEEPEEKEEVVHVLPMRAAPHPRMYEESVPGSQMYKEERTRYYAPLERVVEVARSAKSMTGESRSPAKSVHYSVSMEDNERKSIMYRDGKSEQKSRAATEVSVRSSKSKSRSRVDEPLEIESAPSKVSSHSSRSDDQSTVVRAQGTPLPESVAPSKVSVRSKAKTVVSAKDVALPESVAPSRVSTAVRPERNANDSRPPSSYVSAKTSHSRSRSKSTIRGGDAASSVSRREKGSSHVSRRDKESRVSARDVPLPETEVATRVSRRSRRDSHGGSHVSARHIPLPESHISAQDIELPESVIDDDMVSVAPSDSVSCIGMKRERLDRGLMSGRHSLTERSSNKEERGSRGAMSEADRLRRRF